MTPDKREEWIEDLTRSIAYRLGEFERLSAEARRLEQLAKAWALEARELDVRRARLIAQRTPAEVEQMERERGLR